MSIQIDSTSEGDHISSPEASYALFPSADIPDSVAAEIKKAPVEDRPFFLALAADLAGCPNPTAKHVMDVISRFMAPKHVEALAADRKVMHFRHIRSGKMGEFVPATKGYWFVWWCETDGRMAIKGSKRPLILNGIMPLVFGGDTQIAWKDLELRTSESSVFGHFEIGAPWKYNAALFDSYDDYRERGLGLKNTVRIDAEISRREGGL